ncbi:MAG: cell division protein ZapB, partial [Spirochaetia bacterium]
LEQIKLLENKITRAIELIRVLKEENSTLRKGLESAQKRMKELESLVDGFKTDQREIESVIVRALQHLDELEEAASAARKPDSNGKRPSSAAEEPPRPAGPPAAGPPAGPPTAGAPTAGHPLAGPSPTGPTKEELDIF